MIPPNNKDTEKALLGCLLQDKKLLPAVRAAGGEKLFYFEKHLVIYDAIIKQAAIGEVDLITIASKVEDKIYLNDCYNSAPTTMLAETYAETLKNLYIKRELLKVCHNTTHDINDPDILNRASAAIKDIAKQTNKVKHAKFVDLAADLYEDYRANEGVEPDYMRTGLVDLDRLIDGIEPTEHIIIAGRPGQGKTALAADTVRNVCKQGKKVAFFSMEMSRKVLTRRLLCAEAGIDVKRFRNRRLSEIEKQKAARVLSSFQDWNLKIIDGRVTVSQIESYVIEHEPDLVIVDYLQLMSVDRKRGMTTNDLVGDNVTGLQGIAKSGPAVITLSQLSRASEKENRRPGQADLYESGKIEATGDKIIAPYRPDRGKEEAEILVIKQKDGPIGAVDVLFDGSTITFKNLARQREVPQVMAGAKQWGN